MQYFCWFPFGCSFHLIISIDHRIIAYNQRCTHIWPVRPDAYGKCVSAFCVYYFSYMRANWKSQSLDSPMRKFMCAYCILKIFSSPIVSAKCRIRVMSKLCLPLPCLITLSAVSILLLSPLFCFPCVQFVYLFDNALRVSLWACFHYG